MFKWNRIIVALIGIPLLLFVYLDRQFHGIPLLVFTNFVVGVGVSEFYKMLKASGKEVSDGTLLNGSRFMNCVSADKWRCSPKINKI